MSANRIITEKNFKLTRATYLKGPEIYKIAKFYGKHQRLRGAIDKLKLEDGGYPFLIAELQVSWGSAVLLVKQKVIDICSGSYYEEYTAIQNLAKTLSQVVHDYFSEFPGPKDPRDKITHIHVVAAMSAERLYEIQHNMKRVYSKLLLSKTLQRVQVSTAHLPLAQESHAAFQIRTLTAQLESSLTERKKVVAQNQQLRSDVEVMDNMRQRLDISESSEKDLRQRLHVSESRNKKDAAQILELCTLLEKAEIKLKSNAVEAAAKKAQKE